MRTVVAVLLLLPLLALAAGKEVYKWVDDKGVVHYTDKPPTEGAQPAKLPPLQTYKGAPPANLSKFEKPTPKAPLSAVDIQIVTPARDETFRGGERVVPVAVMVTPQLEEGQRLIYLLDGSPQSQPTADTSFAFTNVERGSHSVSVSLVDEAGNSIGSSGSVTFHMKPPIAGQAGGNSGGGNPPSTNPPPKPTKPPVKKP